MADNILRLKVESSEYDAKLKKAAEGIRHLAEVAHKGGGELTGLEKAELDYVKALGSMETKSRTAAGGVRELESTFKELTVVYNNLNDVEKQDEGGKALRASLDQIKQRAQAARAEIEAASKSLQGMDANSKVDIGGGIFSGLGSKMEGALAVFGGNLMTKAAGAIANLGSEMYGMVQQGIEMAKAGEGVRIAFERLGRGDILDGLRQATHGTVTDLELMKAAVKFNDFKLPVEELGTMLAFAQQKAKDTGQSIDYMTESIVTGLGRKSLMILDNLGLSASEIKERMKETGDMTKAVGAIIRDQMAVAGDYVETAADRAAQANVSLQNKMEELGRKFGPLEQASTQFWTSMKIGILDIVGGPLAELLNGLTEAGRLQNMLNNLNGEGDNTKVGSQLKKLQAIKKAGGSSYMFNSTLSGMMEDYNRQIMALDAQIKNGGKPIGGGSGSSQDVRYLQRQMDALKIMRDELKKGAQGILNSKTPNTTTTTTDPKKGAKEKELTELQQNQQKINDLTQEYVKLGDESTEAARERQAEIQKEIELLKQRNGLLGLRAEQAQGRFLVGAGDFQKSGLSNNPGTLLSTPNTSVSGLMLDDKAMKAVNKQLEVMGKSNIKQLAEVGKETAQSWRGAASAMSAAGSALQGLEDPGAKIAGIVGQAIANIALGFSQATAASSGGGIFGWIAAIAGGLTTMLSTISAIHSATGYAQGGIVDGRGGGFVGGMAYSGDNVGNVRLDSGELVLNRSQQNNLANALEGGNNNNVENRQPYVNGELIYLGVNNYLKRTGRGEIVVSKR